MTKCDLCAKHYGDDGECDRGMPVASPHKAERAALSAAPTACAVADEWERMRQAGQRIGRITGTRVLCNALDALEAATRESPLRKVRP